MNIRSSEPVNSNNLPSIGSRLFPLTLDRNSRRIEARMFAFVSAQIDDKQRVRQLYQRLESVGYSISHDWTRTDDLEDKLAQRYQSGDRAAKDIQGVVDCDLYILLSDNQSVGKGMYVELGAALALHRTFSRPRICIVGPLNHLSIFYLHPAVEHFPSDTELFRNLTPTRRAKRTSALSRRNVFRRPIPSGE